MHLNYLSVFLLYDTKSPDIIFILLVVTRRVWGLTSEIGKKWSFIQPVLLIKQHVWWIFLKFGAVTFLKKDKTTQHWSERQHEPANPERHDYVTCAKFTSKLRLRGIGSNFRYPRVVFTWVFFSSWQLWVLAHDKIYILHYQSKAWWWFLLSWCHHT